MNSLSPPLIRNSESSGSDTGVFAFPAAKSSRSGDLAVAEGLDGPTFFFV